MVRDRLQELKLAANLNNNSDDINEDVIININSPNENITLTLEKYAVIKEWLENVKANTEEMKKIANDIQTKFYQPKSYSELMNQKREQNISLYQRITALLKELENDLPEDDDCSTASRMKFGLYHGNKEDVFRVWKEYTHFLITYEDKIKKIILRQAHIANHSITEEETEILLDNHNAFFTGNILQETQDVRNNLKELVERYHELEKIEKSLREVKEMFVYMATLVQQQGDVIQSIEFHASRASDNVDQGVEELGKANELRIKTLKKKTCILIWLAVILTIIIIILIYV